MHACMRATPLCRCSTTSSKTTAGLSSTRQRLTEERILLIDALTYRLGKYPPRTITADSTNSSSAPEITTATTTTPTTSMRGQSKPPLKGSCLSSAAKRSKLDGLQKKNSLLSSSSSSSLLVSQLPSDGKRLNYFSKPTATRTPPGCGSRLLLVKQTGLQEDLQGIKPHTPPDALQGFLRAQAAEARRARASEEAEDAEDEAERDALLTHPRDLFEDEDAVLHRFGMGGRAGPAHVTGFDGLFRQQWSDFYVTEMTVDVREPCGGRPVSRDLDYHVPELPAHILEAHNANNNGCFNIEDEPDLVGAGGEDGALPDKSFFEVDVAARLSELQREFEVQKNHPSMNANNQVTLDQHENNAHEDNHNDGAHCSDDDRKTAQVAREALLDRINKVEAGQHQEERRQHSSARFYLQCTLHKQHIAHSVALSNLAQTLRIHPRAISVSGIKDYIGDTIQRVRIEDVSPIAAVQANRTFAQRGWRMTLSDFSYESAPLVPGDLFGNHFNIILRDVHVPRASLQEAMESFQANGFPNYYGCQRFSWFAGREDAGFALLRHNWLAFAFKFLNYTAEDRSLRQLLQRERKYPHPIQDEYRRRVVRRLREIAVDPVDLEEAPFLSCPPLSEVTVSSGRGDPLGKKHELIVWQLREAFFDLNPQSRRLTAQRLASYLWNQVLTLRLHHFRSDTVLDGDLVAPEALRNVASNASDRSNWFKEYGDVVSVANRGRYTVRDVVHPGFSFNGVSLPENAVGAYYLQVCEKYGLDWYTKHAKTGLDDFREPPRPIIRHPIDLRYEYKESEGKLRVSFALERGCYANVAITELMRCARCVGSEDIMMLPAPEALWEQLGKRDPGYVTSMQDIYKDYEDGVGFVSDRADVPVREESEKRVWDMEGPLFLPESEDPARKAHSWGARNLLRNMERRQRDTEAMTRQLFEKPLADKMLDTGDIGQYAGHTVPLMPNAKGKRIFFKVLRRQQQYAGAPRQEMRIKRGAQVQNKSHSIPAFKTLNKNSWNVSW